MEDLHVAGRAWEALRRAALERVNAWVVSDYVYSAVGELYARASWWREINVFMADDARQVAKIVFVHGDPLDYKVEYGDPYTSRQVKVVEWVKAHADELEAAVAPQSTGKWWADENYYPIRPIFVGEEDVPPAKGLTKVDERGNVVEHVGPRLKHGKVITTLGRLRRLVREEATRADLEARGSLKDPSADVQAREEQEKEDNLDKDVGLQLKNPSARGPGP